MENELIAQLAANLDEHIKVNGIWERIDGPIIKFTLNQGYDSMLRKSPELAKEFLELVEAYLTADSLGMVDEAADLMASIIKVIFFNKSMRKNG